MRGREREREKDCFAESGATAQHRGREVRGERVAAGE